MRRRVGAALLASVALAGCGGAGDGSVPVEGDGWRGVMLVTEPMALADGTPATSRLPEVADVQRFEEALPPAYDGVRRQYTELSAGDRRELLVNGIGTTWWSPGFEDTWSYQIAGDFGACVWQASMDLATGEIGDVRFSGIG